MTLRRWPIYPFFLAAILVLNIALSSDVEPSGFIRPLAVAVASTGLLLALAWLIFRNRGLAGLLVTGVIVLVFTLVPAIAIEQATSRAFGPLAGGGAATVWLAVAFVTPILLALRLRTKPERLLQVTGALNASFLVLLAIVIVTNVGPDIPGMIDRPGARTAFVGASSEEPPDIYVVLLDGYPGADVLERRFNIDNTPFLSQLRERGFEVAEGSHSNYVFTQLTLSSMFQMRHVDEIPSIEPLIGVEGGHNGVLRSAICDGAAFATLRENGYEILSVSAGYEHAALRCVADRVLDHGEMTDLERAILERSWILDLLAQPWPTVLSGPQRDRIAHGFADLRQLAAESRDHPLFAFGHVPAPHLPIVVGADGAALPVSPRDFDANTAQELGISDEEFANLYASQLSYLNAEVLATIDEITNSSAQPPVVILMSDHGYIFDAGLSANKFGNFLAWSTPGAPGLLGGDATPVNYLPLLLNRYLGTQVPLSDRRFFYSPGPLQQLLLTEVTDSAAPGG